MTLAVRTILAAILLTATIGWQIGGRVLLIQRGQEVVLTAAPIDPRDLFRGDYVQLRYDVSTISPDQMQGDIPRGGGRTTVYAVLKPQGETYALDFATIKRSDIPAGRLFMTGEAQSGFPSSPTATSRISVSYGAEQYFVPQGHGRDLGAATRESRVDIVLSVDPDGYAAIKALRLDGREVYREGLF